MSVPLIPWLYNDDYKRGLLVVYPRILQRWNVASLIISECSKNCDDSCSFVIITDNPYKYDIGDVSILTYSELDEINEVLQSRIIVLFDDARMLSIISSALRIGEKEGLNGNKIIILTTWGDTLRQLTTITEKFPNLSLCDLDIVNDRNPITWRITRTSMSPRQVKYYNLVREREINAPVSNKIISYPITRMLTLYSYSDSIMLETLTRAEMCQHLDISPHSLTTKDLEQLSINGPKLMTILDGIISNYGSKQIVLTRFNQYYGVDLITEFLKLQQTPYELTEIFHLSCTDSYEDMIQTLIQFNKSSTAVLITNIVPVIHIDNISIIHIVDTYSFLTLQGVLGKINTHSITTTLTIYSHLATHPTDKSADEVLYNNLEGYIQETNQIYNDLRARGNKIIFHPVYGLLL